jgi:hypothetical protein
MNERILSWDPTQRSLGMRKVGQRELGAVTMRTLCPLSVNPQSFCTQSLGPLGRPGRREWGGARSMTNADFAVRWIGVESEAAARRWRTSIGYSRSLT